MKRTILILLAAAVGFVAASVIVSKHQEARHANDLAQLRDAWDAEKADLESKVNAAKGRTVVETVILPGEAKEVASQPDPQALLNELANLKITPGQPRSMRRIIGLLDQLPRTGSPAVPVISKFLASNADVAYESGGKPPRDVQALTTALAPLSLRSGLFDVLKQIGGEDAENALVEALGNTSRAFEVAYLSNLLEQMAPGKYRDNALTAAKGLLAVTAPGRERDWLFGVLKQFGDTTYVATAQGQLVLADGKVDTSALRYLQQTLGENSVAIAAQAYRDTRVTDADSKEPLARVALNYVGVSEQAEQFFHAAITDQTLKPDLRRELAEDLNQDGISNEKNPTPADLKIIANRLVLIEAYLKTDYVQNDKFLNAGFREANKDLANMLQHAVAKSAK